VRGCQIITHTRQANLKHPSVVVRVIYDSTLFLHENVGGIARYFIELANRIGGMRDAPTVTILAGANGSQVSRADFHHARFKGVRMPSFRGSWRLYKALNDLMLQMTLAGSSEPTILHETYYGAPPLVTKRSKRVITVYDMIWEEEEFTGSENWVSRAKRISAERADGILFISESTKTAFHRHYPQRCAEAVVHLGCELRTTRGRNQPGFPWPFILYVGRRELYKNWSRFVAAAGRKQLWRTHGLVHVGKPMTASDLKVLQAAGIPSDRVVTLRCDDDELADLYTSADCFVFPTLVEGFGIPLLEAARCSCPIACSDIPVFREILPNGAQYFDPYSADEIAAAITGCLESGRRSPDVALAKATAETFSWQRTAEQTMLFYRSLLS
jgi:glycosyltransferase involved in cell wall biosynthesis